jgi:hypothetical protein
MNVLCVLSLLTIILSAISKFNEYKMMTVGTIIYCSYRISTVEKNSAG